MGYTTIKEVITVKYIYCTIYYYYLQLFYMWSKLCQKITKQISGNRFPVHENCFFNVKRTHALKMWRYNVRSEASFKICLNTLSTKKKISQRLPGKFVCKSVPPEISVESISIANLAKLKYFHLYATEQWSSPLHKTV